ncbi:MAG: hypothetical protein N2578_07905, partial [Bdellovibrionaceae bacterium]|nr:hypothetical protein [Pseudobdellovibrionaceae bacterium]
MKKKLLFSIMALLLSLLPAGGRLLAQDGEEYRRFVSFDLEPVEGAASYEVELTPKKGPPRTIKTKDAVWSGRLAPGSYLMRLRARDYRGVPGEWSEPVEFDVGLEAARMIFPTHNSKIQGKDSEQNVEFKWHPVPGASHYALQVISKDGEFNHSLETTKTSTFVKVPLGKSYTWKLTAVSKSGVVSEGVSVADFIVSGLPLLPPSIQKPDSPFVRSLTWEAPKGATEYDVVIGHKDPKTGKWKVVKELKDFAGSEIPFEDSWPGGKWQVAVRAKGPERSPSPYTKLTFEVKSGDRSPAAEKAQEARYSIEKLKGWYFIASYLITEINYSSINPVSYTHLTL